MNRREKSGQTGIKTAQQPQGRKPIIAQNPKQNPGQKTAQNIRLAISTAGISIGVALLFIAAAGVDGTAVSTKQITELCVLGVLSAFGGMLGLKMEGVLGR